MSFAYSAKEISEIGPGRREYEWIAGTNKDDCMCDYYV
jgi:hypothetical protein